MTDRIPPRPCRVCGAEFIPPSKYANSATKCSDCRPIRDDRLKKPRESPCVGCGVIIVQHGRGRTRLRCDGCLSEKQLRERAARPSSRRGSIPCHQCGCMLYDTVALPGVWTYCPECGPGPGITRKTACAHCRRLFSWVHRGGAVLEQRKWLCHDCSDMVRWCPRCNQVLEAEEFARSSGKRDGRSAHCRGCSRVTYHGQSEDKKLLGTIRRFSLTVEQFRSMLADQGGACAICRTPKEDCPRGYLMVDHDHACCAQDKSCGRCVRGLLCSHCNFAIGLLRDDPGLLAAAQTYLVRHPPAETFTRSD